MKVLVVVDMQNDFINGALGTKEAEAIVPHVAEKIKGFNGTVLFTRDTHEKEYLNTQEGMKLPVEHCIRDTCGWQLAPKIEELRKTEVIDKSTFGSIELGNCVKELNPEEVTLVGLCTDICVISNAMIIKAFLPEVPVKVDASCCAGVTPESHERALEAMKMCQIEIL